MKSETAERLTDLVDEAVQDGKDDLGTKTDLERLRLELLAEMQSRFNSHLRWVMAMWGSTIAAIVALAVAIILRGS